MWNLRYNNCGAIERFPYKGTNPKKKKSKKQKRKEKRKQRAKAEARSEKRFVPNCGLWLIPKKWETRDRIPVMERRKYLKGCLDKGRWIAAGLREQHRRDFDKVKDILCPLKGQMCWACGAPPEHRHHIIPLCRGGANNKRNLVPLCKCCHGLLHPWMELKESLAVTARDTTCEPSVIRAEAEQTGQGASLDTTTVPRLGPFCDLERALAPVGA